jgi:hypothetical protein
LSFNYKNLKCNLTKLLEGSISGGEITELVQLSRSIIQSYLGCIRNSITQLCLHQGLTITDLAYDCIAEAFAKDEHNNFPQIENFINSLREKLDTISESSLFLAFKQFMICVADAELARLYAQSDPNGAKIYRNIRDCVKRSCTLSLEKDFRGCVIRSCDADTLKHLPPFPYDELERRLRERMHNDDSTPELLGALHDILIEQSTYRRSVPLIDVVQVVKQRFREGYEAKTDENIALDGLLPYEIDSIRKKVERALKEKIVLTYLARGKIERRQAEAISSALHDMLDDWSNSGGDGCSLYGYLRRHLQVDEEQYETEFRPKMEYLLKIAREEFAARLMREI